MPHIYIHLYDFFDCFSLNNVLVIMLSITLVTHLPKQFHLCCIVIVRIVSNNNIVFIFHK